MKKVSKRIRGILLSLMYVAIYYAISMIVYGIYYVWHVMRGSLSASHIEQSFNDGAYALTVIASVICLWIYMLIGRFRRKPLTESIGTRRVPHIIYVMAGALAVGCRFLVAVYYSFAQKSYVLQKSIERSMAANPNIETLSTLAVALFSVIVIAPLFEEVLFRGLVMGELMKIMRPWAAITLQAIIFGVAHGVIFQSIFACALGIILGIVYYRTENIKAAVICHSVFNLSAVLMQDNLSFIGVLVFLSAGTLLCSLSLFYIIDNSKNR